MKEIRKARERKVADDPAFYRIEKDLDHVLDLLAGETHHKSRQDTWHWVCLYAENFGRHPIEHIACWVREYSLNGELCRLVGRY